MFSAKENRTVLYVHGKDGSAKESERYKALFPGYTVVGLDYETFSPWETGREISAAVKDIRGEIILIANSIGAYFSLCAGIDDRIGEAYFISPVVDMERMILDLMALCGVEERDLQKRGVIPTDFGEDLSWEYLSYVRSHPVRWNAPTHILYGSEDRLVPFETVCAFSKNHGASLTVMEGGEHWFHTEEQMRFLDAWVRETRGEN